MYATRTTPYSIVFVKEENEDIYDLPLYSRIVLNENEQLVVFMNQSGDLNVVFEFKENRLAVIHYGVVANATGASRSPAISYPVFGTNTFTANFKNLYSFRFKIDPSQKIIYIYSPTYTIPYTNKVCLMKPILQTRGFCYYHAVLHGLLIPPTFQKLCYNELLKYMETLQSGKDTRYRLERFMNIDICEDYKNRPNLSPSGETRLERLHRIKNDTRYFVMKFFYQYLFYYDEMADRIVRNANERILKSQHPSASPTRQSHPVEVMVAYTEHENNIQSLDDIPEKGGNENIVLNILFRDVFDWLVFLHRTNSPIHSKDIRYIMTDGGFSTKEQPPTIEPGYKLEIGFIGINYTKNGINTGHVITGINCDGKTYILNSSGYNTNAIECDWTTMEGLLKSQEIQNYLYNIVHKAKYTLRSITLTYYYIHNDILKENTSKQFRDRIKRQFIYPKMMKAIEASSLDETIKRRLLYLPGVEDTTAIAKYEDAHPETWTLPSRRGGQGRRKGRRLRKN